MHAWSIGRFLARAFIAAIAIAAFWWAPPWISLAVPVAANFALAVYFGQSMRRGVEPMVSRFARAERGTLGPELVRYTRRLTAVWTGFFLAVGAGAALLASFGDSRAWLLFALIGNAAMVALLLVVEYLWRRHRFPGLLHDPPWTMFVTALRVMAGKNLRGDPAP